MVHHSASSADDDDDSVNGALDLFMCARRSWAITIGAPSLSALLRWKRLGTRSGTDGAVDGGMSGD